jgi:hypothetical protein
VGRAAAGPWVKRGAGDGWQPAGRAGRTPVTYEFVVRGDLGNRFPEAFGGLSRVARPTVPVPPVPTDGYSVIRGDMVDQAQLIGTIVWLADCGVEIVSIIPVPGAREA